LRRVAFAGQVSSARGRDADSARVRAEILPTPLAELPDAGTDGGGDEDAGSDGGDAGSVDAGNPVEDGEPAARRREGALYQKSPGPVGAHLRTSFSNLALHAVIRLPK
jgi:hypothetical protein